MCVCEIFYFFFSFLFLQNICSVRNSFCVKKHDWSCLKGNFYRCKKSFILLQGLGSGQTKCLMMFDEKGIPFKEFVVNLNMDSFSCKRGKWGVGAIKLNSLQGKQIEGRGVWCDCVCVFLFWRSPYAVKIWGVIKRLKNKELMRGG